MPTLHLCQLCGAPLTRTFVDLGMSPLCESYVPEDKLDEAEVFYPLHVRLCDTCLLVQLPAYVSGEHIFSDYAYFSSYSDRGIRSDLLSDTVDRSPVKQEKLLPGTHIPIYVTDRLAETRPDYILVLPWNLPDEISRQLSYVGSWGESSYSPFPSSKSFRLGCES